MNNFGEILKKKRREKELSQTFIAKKIHKTQPTIWRWERNPIAANKITLEDIEIIASVFDMSTIDFLKLITFKNNPKES